MRNTKKFISIQQNNRSNVGANNIRPNPIGVEKGECYSPLQNSEVLERSAEPEQLQKFSIIELQKESMHFSAGHFTIFSATERENFHGHNYQVSIALHTWVDHMGLNFDYRFYKNCMHALCRKLDQTFLIPGDSPYLNIKIAEKDYIWIDFHDEKIPFLARDITIIPVTNITVEALSDWFVKALIEDKQQLIAHQIHKIMIKVYSSPGQSGSACWEM